jgi:hypothetical protein
MHSGEIELNASVSPSQGVLMKNETNKFKRVTGLALVTLLLTVGLVGLCPVGASVPIGGNHHVWIDMTNGAFWSNLSSGNANQSYYFKFDGGGLNALHISNSPLVSFGQIQNNVSSGGNASGTFYVTDTGGRGFNDDIVLMVAVGGEYNPSTFNLGIDASGYRWQPTAVKNQVPAYGDLHRVNDAVNQYFTSANFSEYDPQVQKPYTTAQYPIFYGQGDFDTLYNVGFIDLKVGDLGSNSTVKYADSLIDNGSVKVAYNITGLGSDDVPVAINAFAWCNQSNQGRGITWTNDLTSSVANGLAINNPYI